MSARGMRLGGAARAYFSIFRMRFKMETQYRAAALGGMACQTFFGLILIALYRALYAGRPQTTPLESVVTYVWLQQAFFLLITSTDGELAENIRTGAIAYDLCRPVHWYAYYYLRAMAQKLVGTGLRAIPMMCVAALLPSGWRVGAPASAGHLFAAAGALLMGYLCVCALDNVAMAFTMRTLDNRGMQALIKLTVVTFSGNLLPLTLFPDGWQRVITLLPFAQLLDAPIRLYTGERALSDAPRVIAAQAAWTLILVGLGLFMWKRHEKRLIVQGG